VSHQGSWRCSVTQELNHHHLCFDLELQLAFQVLHPALQTHSLLLRFVGIPQIAVALAPFVRTSESQQRIGNSQYLLVQLNVLPVSVVLLVAWAELWREGTFPFHMAS
jgi:hypothetical protein